MDPPCPFRCLASFVGSFREGINDPHLVLQLLMLALPRCGLNGELFNLHYDPALELLWRLLQITVENAVALSYYFAGSVRCTHRRFPLFLWLVAEVPRSASTSIGSFVPVWIVPLD